MVAHRRAISPCAPAFTPRRRQNAGDIFAASRSSGDGALADRITGRGRART
ncbi:hypothetical protein ACDP63_00315 [Paracoccus sp. P2]|uniref:hypothetical protein n=1 Tax=Paracoccus sp. P2 TaxID=3248840 RepID=UPI0012DCE3C9